VTLSTFLLVLLGLYLVLWCLAIAAILIVMGRDDRRQLWQLVRDNVRLRRKERQAPDVVVHDPDNHLLDRIQRIR
jgi:hypothetical protein